MISDPIVTSNELSPVLALDLLMTVGLSMVCFGVLLLVRNDWVHTQRAKLINGQKWGMSCYFTNLDLFLASYNSMVYRFWVWRVSAFATNRELYQKIVEEIAQAEGDDDGN